MTVIKNKTSAYCRRSDAVNRACVRGVICASMKLQAHLSKLLCLLLLTGCKSYGSISSGCSSVDSSWSEPLAKEFSKHLNEIEILSNDKTSLEIISKARRIYWYKKNERDYLVCVQGDKNGCGDFFFPVEKIDNIFLMAELTEITVC